MLFPLRQVLFVVSLFRLTLENIVFFVFFFWARLLIILYYIYKSLRDVIFIIYFFQLFFSIVTYLNNVLVLAKPSSSLTTLKTLNLSTA